MFVFLTAGNVSKPPVFSGAYAGVAAARLSTATLTARKILKGSDKFYLVILATRNIIFVDPRPIHFASLIGISNNQRVG